MIILIKNKHTLKFDDFKFKCSIGKRGISLKKVEGDLKTPKGIFSIGNLFYRADRLRKPITKLKAVKINKTDGWCNDTSDKKNYNKLIRTNIRSRQEKLQRIDTKYDLLIPIKYNYKNPKIPRGSCIFLHLTKNYNPTAGCIALKKKDFLILLKLISPKTKIRIG